jgi:hypothetical protein
MTTVSYGSDIVKSVSTLKVGDKVHDIGDTFEMDFRLVGNGVVTSTTPESATVSFEVGKPYTFTDDDVKYLSRGHFDYAEAKNRIAELYGKGAAGHVPVPQ